MAAGRHNVVIEQGTTWSLTLTWKQDDTPIDLTGSTARMQARTSVDASSTVLSLTSNDGITLGGTAGTITMHRTAVQTSALPAGVFVYDIEVESAGHEVIRLLEGTLRVKAEVTR